MATYIFRIDQVDINFQKADSEHSDDDWLSFVVTVGDPVTKNARTFSSGPFNIGRTIHTGDKLIGPFTTDPITAADSDVVVISYLVTNLGSSKFEDQFAQAVKVTDHVVGVLAPIVGAAVGLFVGSPGEGLKFGQAIAKGLDTVVSTLSDVFDFLGIHIGPANCNGEVLHDTLTYQPNELQQAVNRQASRHYTTPQTNKRCGRDPESTVSFSVVMVLPGPELYYRGTDNSVWSRWRNPDGHWSDEKQIGGMLSGDPIAAVVPGTNLLKLFYRGADNSVWSIWRRSNGTGEQRIGGVLNGDPIAAVVPGTNILQLFYRGADNSIWSRWYNPDGHWSDEQHIGGRLNGDPIAAVVPGTNILQLFYRGADNSIWSRWRTPDGHWSDEQQIGGRLNGDPIAAVVPGTNILQLFYRGVDNSIWSRWRNPNGHWSDEQQIGGRVNGDPIAAVVPGTNILQLFYRSADNSVWSRWRNPDGHWSDEQKIGGVLNGDPIAAVVPGTNILQLFYRGVDNSVWSRWRRADGNWSGEQHIGGVLKGDPIAVVRGHSA
ncbi:hypothetical protein [Piscinibacter terrae]|nr:hypothetical protein [Albitalea terrae]